MSTITSGNFTFTTTSIEGVIIVDVKSYGDARGYFMETYKRPDFVTGGIGCDFVQDNQSSSTKGEWEGVILSAENHRQFFIPRGFAHGFLVLSDEAEFCYKCDDTYHPNDEGGLMWNDPAIGVEWPPLEGDQEFDADKILLSDKDKLHAAFEAVRKQLHERAVASREALESSANQDQE